MTTMRVLVVCTGNLCRSPLAAEILTRAAELGGLDLDVTSAGTRAALDLPVPGALIDVAGDAATALERHRPTQLTPGAIRDADLVLTADRGQRRAVVSLAPVATRRTFTLRELARVFREADALEATSSPRDRVAELAAIRGTVSRPEVPTDDDVPDPFRGDTTDYRRAAELNRASIEMIVQGLQR